MRMRNKKTRIMVFGTFDGLHPGHLNFFKQAKKLAREGELIVSVARDKNVFLIKKKYPHFNEKKRVEIIKKLAKKTKKINLIRKVILSGLKDHLPHIVKEKPDIIALGYDQRAYVQNLKKDLKNKGILVKIVRLQPYKKNIYKNNLLKLKSGVK